MKTTAMYFSSAGAQRVTVIREDGDTGTSIIETRDGDAGSVPTNLLSAYREEEDE